MHCTRGLGARTGAHIELFAAGRVVVLPAGIGIAPPRRRRGAFVDGGRCAYPVATTAPTGVVEVAAARRSTVGDLFAVWQQPLLPRRLASFGGRVRAYLNGREAPGDPRALALDRHAQIVLEVGPYVPPHARFAFPPGL